MDCLPDVLRQPLRASADGWESGRRIGSASLKYFTPRAQDLCIRRIAASWFRTRIKMLRR
jgi:hypothetical protein